MAVTGIWKIEGRLDKVLDYTTNENKTYNDNFGNYQALHNVIDYVGADYKTEQQFFVSGINCSKNPSLEGYNNPYGYNNYFYNRLTKFIEDANQNGYKIVINNQGCRSYNTQVYYYSIMTKGRAANPGLSLHGYGIASDLEFYQSNGYLCPTNRNENNCPSMNWAHKNAEKYGLTFPLLNASYKEDWHIEPMYKNKY